MPDETLSQWVPLSRQVPNSEAYACRGEDKHHSLFAIEVRCPLFYRFDLLTVLALEFEPVPRRYGGIANLLDGDSKP